MKGLILDLRDDPGGLLSSAVEVSDLFIKEGKIVTTKGRNVEAKTYEAQEEGTFSDFPMVILINESSASAAEIVSACLQDHKRAKVVGQRSFGKGSVQNIMELEDGNSVLKLTVATYYRPSNKNIHKFKGAKDSDEWGVSPDQGLEVKYTPEEHMKFYISRRERDLKTLSDKLPEKPKEVKVEDKDGGKDGKAREPFVDRQLEKAVAVIKEEIDAPAAAARAEK
jgi:carboxyl-terminal processing protease